MKGGIAFDPWPAKPLIIEMIITEGCTKMMSVLNHTQANSMKKQHQPLYSKPNYYHTAMNYPLVFYIMTQSTLFIPSTHHVRFNPSVRRHAVKLCCEIFFTYPVILLAHNSISMLRKRGEAKFCWRRDSHGSQVFF